MNVPHAFGFRGNCGNVVVLAITICCMIIPRYCAQEKTTDLYLEHASIGLLKLIRDYARDEASNFTSTEQLMLIVQKKDAPTVARRCALLSIAAYCRPQDIPQQAIAAIAQSDGCPILLKDSALVCLMKAMLIDIPEHFKTAEATLFSAARDKTISDGMRTFCLLSLSIRTSSPQVFLRMCVDVSLEEETSDELFEGVGDAWVGITYFHTTRDHALNAALAVYPSGSLSQKSRFRLPVLMFKTLMPLVGREEINHITRRDVHGVAESEFIQSRNSYEVRAYVRLLLDSTLTVSSECLQTASDGVAVRNLVHDARNIPLLPVPKWQRCQFRMPDSLSLLAR
jgi:hypothetical protein